MKGIFTAVLLCLFFTAAYAHPKTLVLISTQQNYWWNEEAIQYESTLRQELIQAGFTILDQGQLQRVADRQLLTRIVQGDLLAAVTLATNFKADAVVVSRVDTALILSTRVSFVNVFTYRALSDVKVILASTGQIISSRSSEMVGTGASDKDARLASLRALGGQTGKEVSANIKQVAKGSSRIVLTITGIKSFTDATVLLRELSAQEGVASAERKSFANGTVEVEVAYSGKIDDLAAILEGLTLTKLEITGVSGQAIEAKVR